MELFLLNSWTLKYFITHNILVCSIHIVVRVFWSSCNIWHLMFFLWNIYEWLLSMFIWYQFLFHMEQRSLLNYVPYVPTCLTCLCALLAYVPSCLKLIRAYVPTCPCFSRAHVPTATHKIYWGSLLYLALLFFSGLFAEAATGGVL